MGPSSGDENRLRGRPAPGHEPEPTELWIDAGAPDQPGGPAEGLSGPSPGSGAAGRNRWIALGVGFVVLVAVIAVQHFATGGPSASPDTPTSAVTEPAPTPSDRNDPSTSESSAGTVTADPSVLVPQDSVNAELSHAVADMNSARQAGDGAASSAAASSATQAPDTTSPITRAVPKQALLGARDWELFGYGAAGLVRYSPATGTVTVTPMPVLTSDTVLSLAVTSSAAIIRPMEGAGYVIADGKGAAPLAGLLAQGVRVLPGPDPAHVWTTLETPPDGTVETSSVATGDEGPPQVSLALVDSAGRPTGTELTIPASLLVTSGYAVTGDGTGYALTYGVGGIYDVRPDGLSLVTHGDLLAVGPTRYLVYDCDDSGTCRTPVVNRKDHSRHVVAGLATRAWFQSAPGVVSPDGSEAALMQYTASGTVLVLVDLATGKTRTIDTGSGLNGSGDSTLAFSPDGRYLLVAGAVGVVPVDVRTGDLLPPLPFPPVTVLAVRATPGS